MTGFAAGGGEGGGVRWSWELRAVNGRGLDLRLRLPDGLDGLDPPIRAEVGRRVQRGSLVLTLRLDRDEAGRALALDRAGLAAALSALAAVEEAALDADVRLAPATAAEVLGLPGVLAPAADAPDAEALRTALLADLRALLDAFEASRAAEGAALARLLAGQIARIETLAGEAAVAAAERATEQAAALRAAVARLVEAGAGAAVEPARLAQELALLAVKSDVTEEIDRLRAHAAAARALLDETGPVGRRLDFLTQEMNREANTLCAKAGSAALTRIGLDLKAVIDQMREQVQNLE